MAFERYAATFDEVGVGLVSLLPCYTVFHRIANIIYPIVDLNEHSIYQYFVEPLTTNIDDISWMTKYHALITHHYNNPSTSSQEAAIDVRNKMLETYFEGLEWEWKFAESGLTTEGEKINSTVLSFTDFVESKVAVDWQQQMIEHDFWKQLAEGTLSGLNFETLVQQDLIYMTGFFSAIELMEKSQQKLETEQRLQKNGVEEFGLLLAQDALSASQIDVAVQPYVEGTLYTKQRSDNNISFR